MIKCQNSTIYQNMKTRNSYSNANRNRSTQSYSHTNDSIFSNYSKRRAKSGFTVKHHTQYHKSHHQSIMMYNWYRCVNITDMTRHCICVEYILASSVFAYHRSIVESWLFLAKSKEALCWPLTFIQLAIIGYKHIIMCCVCINIEFQIF